MELLGDLGIDINLLVAQIINFGLLLWILAKFLYKPIVKRIERDEIELKQAQTQKKELELDKEAFERKKKKEIAEIRKRSRVILKEAEDMAKEMGRQSLERIEKETKAMMAMAEAGLQSQGAAIKKDVLKKFKAETVENFQKTYEKEFSISSRKEFQDIFWANLIKQIKGLKLKKLKESDLADIGKKKNLLKIKLEEIVAQKIGPIVLEYALSPDISQNRELEEIISEKIGLKVKISKKQNKSIINGFRFEIMGIIIESNLLNIIQNAANIKK